MELMVLQIADSSASLRPWTEREKGRKGDEERGRRKINKETMFLLRNYLLQESLYDVQALWTDHGCHIDNGLKKCRV